MQSLGLSRAVGFFLPLCLVGAAPLLLTVSQRALKPDSFSFPSNLIMSAWSFHFFFSTFASKKGTKRHSAIGSHFLFSHGRVINTTWIGRFQSFFPCNAASPSSTGGNPQPVSPSCSSPW